MRKIGPCGHPLDTDAARTPASAEIWPRLRDLMERGETEAARRALEDCLDGFRLAAQRLHRAALVFDHTADGIVVTDAEARIIAVNQAFARLTGYDEAEVLGRTPAVLQSGRHDPAFYQALWSALRTSGTWQGEIWNRRKNGDIYPEWLSISAIAEDGGAASHYVGVFSDISSIKHAQAVVEYTAHHDALTGLPNRTLLRARLEHGIQQSTRDRKGLAVLFVDLDRFKDVNDSLGHPVGDQLLQTVAQAMGRLVRGGDTLARLGGDEFIVLVEDSSAPEQAATVARKLLALFDRPFRVGQSEMFITASIGISVFPGDGKDADTLIRNADLAMYQVKASGRNNYQFYEADMTARIIERTRLESALRGALGRSEFRLHYQPQIDLESGELTGVEALIRWHHPQLGLVPPARFIPAAEEIGLINDIGAWVLRESCRQVAAWRQSGLAIPQLAVNLSVHQLERDNLLPRVAEILVETGLDAPSLELEVTESTLMRQTDDAVGVLKRLRDLGVRVAVDDFGTGYSSLGYLKRLPLNRLKIDQSFVRDLPHDGNDLAITRAIIALGGSLGLDVVAEGVERHAQADHLLKEGCRVAQGYLFGRPMMADDLARAWR